MSPAELRAALHALPVRERDAFVDALLQVPPPPDDGPDLPRGCVPYLPCPADALLRIADVLRPGPGDLIVDIGAGVGRAAAILHALTGAPGVGLEVQPALVAAGRAWAPAGVRFVEGDVDALPLPDGSVFLLYCPFSGARLERLLARLEARARAHPLAVCCVDLPLPPCPWLTPVDSLDGLAIFRASAQ